LVGWLVGCLFLGSNCVIVTNMIHRVIQTF
jgi:hypothetical protein